MNWSIPWSVGGHLFPMVFAMIGVKLATMIHGPFGPEEFFVVAACYAVGGGIVGVFVCAMVIDRRIRLPRQEVFRVLKALALASSVGLVQLAASWIGVAVFGPVGLLLGPALPIGAGFLFLVVIVTIRMHRHRRRRAARSWVTTVSPTPVSASY